MTVSYDAVSQKTEARGPSNPQTHSWTHTPSGTPKAILVWIVTDAAQTTAADNAVESVTYGGTSMTKVAEVHGTGGEFGAAWLYELLTSVPTGAQTVAASVRGFPTSSTATYPYIMGFAVSLASAGGAILRADSDTLVNGNLTDPSVTMDAGANTGISFLGGYSARPDVSSITAATGCTITSSINIVNTDDTAVVIRQTTPATGTFAIGYTASADDVAMVAATYYEQAATNAPGGNATGTGAGYAAKNTVSVGAYIASAVATVSTGRGSDLDLEAPTATATGAAHTAPANVLPDAEQATATGAAYQPPLSATIGAAAATGAASQPGATVRSSAAAATATGAAANAITTVAPNAALASPIANVAALSPSVDTTTYASAQAASATGAASGASETVRPNAQAIAATGAASGPGIASDSASVVASGYAAAQAEAVLALALIAAASGYGSGAGSAHDASVTVAPSASVIAIVAAANTPRPVVPTSRGEAPRWRGGRNPRPIITGAA